MAMANRILHERLELGDIVRFFIDNHPAIGMIVDRNAYSVIIECEDGSLIENDVDVLSSLYLLEKI